MTSLKMLGAAAVVASTLASPAMAQQVVYNPGYCAQFYPNANCQNWGPGNPHYSGRYYDRRHHVVYRGGNRYADTNAAWSPGWNDGYYDRPYGSGFWPADVAAGVVGGAIGTAGAIASAPFRAADAAAYNSYAWDNGYYEPRPQTFAQRNGFVCTPGTRFKGDDGLLHICQ